MGAVLAVASPSAVFLQEPATTGAQGTGVVGGAAPSGVMGAPSGTAQQQELQRRLREAQATKTPPRSSSGGVTAAGGQEGATGVVAPSANPVVPRAAAPTNDRQAAPSGPGIKLNFSNADITRVINSIMQELGYSYVIDPQVQGTVNIFSMREIPRERLFSVLEQLLKMNGLAIVQQEDYYVVVPIAESPTVPHGVLMNAPSEPTQTESPTTGTEGESKARPESPETETAVAAAEETGIIPGGGGGQAAARKKGPDVIRVEPAGPIEEKGVVTYVIPLNYILSDDMLKMAQVFLSPGSTVVDFAPANMLIVTDFPQNIEQVLTLVDLLDTRYFELNKIDLISIRFNNATDVAEDLAKIFAPGDSAAGVRIVAIERLNSILVVTRSADVFEQVKMWVKKLDAPSSTSNIKTYVYQVENSTSVQIAQILAELYQDGLGLPSGASGGLYGNQEGQLAGGTQGSLLGQSGRGSYGGRAGFVPSGGGYGGGSYGGGYGGSSYGGGYGGSYGGYGGGYGGGSYGGGYGSSGGFGGRQSLGGGGAVGMRELGPALSSSSQSQIRSIYAGNVKLVVNEFNNSLIMQGTEADIQFMLETIRQLDTLPRQVWVEAKIFSVELRDDLNFGVSAFLQAQGVGSTDADGNFLPATTGSLVDGALSATTRAMVGSEREIQAIVSALREKTNVQVLDAPRVLALDGTPASINIGAEVPVTSASFGNPLQSGTTNFVNSIQFRPTGTTLLFVPRISASGIVTMDIVLEISSATGPALTPTINRNYIQSSFIVRDGQSIGIAGLISDSYNNTKQRVPVLGDIPILGALFGTTAKNERRFELVIFITPKVIRNLPTSTELTLDFKRGLRNAYDFINRMDSEQENLIEQRRQEELKAGGAAEQPKPESGETPPSVDVAPLVPEKSQQAIPEKPQQTGPDKPQQK